MSKLQGVIVLLWLMTIWWLALTSNGWCSYVFLWVVLCMGTITLCLDLQPLKQNWWKQIARFGVYLISTAWRRSGKGQNWKVKFHSMKENSTSTHYRGEKRNGNES